MDLHKKEVIKSQFNPQKVIDSKNLMGLRIGVCMILILAIIYNIEPNNKKEQTLQDGECMRDYTFIWTA